MAPLFHVYASGSTTACTNGPARHAWAMEPIHLPATIAVAGVSFRQAELRSVVEGDTLLLETDDDNAHDSQAITVRTADGVLLGFVPKRLAPRLRATGATTWPARVKELLRHDTWGIRIEVHPCATLLESPRDRIAAALQRGSRATEREETSLAAAPVPDSPSGAAPVARRARRLVVAPSGRVLGVLVREDADRVIAVRDGVEVSFPARSVTLRSE